MRNQTDQSTRCRAQLIRRTSVIVVAVLVTLLLLLTAVAAAAQAAGDLTRQVVTLPVVAPNNPAANALTPRTPLADNQPPTSTAVSPNYSLVATIPVSYTASDGHAGSGIKLVRLHFKFGTGDWITTSYTNTAESATFYFVAANGDGTYYFQTVATDNANNVEDGPAGNGDTNTMYDTVAPTSSASPPAYDTGGLIPVGWTASDATSGPGQTCLWYKFGSGGTWTASGLCSGGTSGTFNFNPPTSDDGTYYFQTVATDNAGNSEAAASGSGDGQTLRDSVPPASSANSPTYDTGGTIPVIWVASDATSGPNQTCLWYKFGSGGTWTASGLCSAGTSGTFNFDPTSGDGTYYFQTVATDVAGNSEAAASGSGDTNTIRDTVPPSSTASSPTYDNGETIPVGWTTSDSTSGPNQTCLWYKFGSGGTWTASGQCSSGTSGTWEFNPTGGDGTYYFQTVATDNAGNSEAAAAGGGDDNTVRDTLPPASQANPPAYDNGGPIPVAWTVSDAASGPNQTCLWYKFGSGGTWTASGQCSTGTSGTFSFSPTSGDGTYYFQTVATDNAGNSEAAASSSGDGNTVRDTVAPSASVSSPVKVWQRSWTVTWSGADPAPGSGIATYQVEYRVDNNPWQTWHANTSLSSDQFGPSTPVAVQFDHNYSFRVRATDLAGNIGGTSTVATTVVEKSQVYLPIVVGRYYPLDNGGFEDGWAGWSHGGELSQSVTTADRHSGTSAALLGNPAYPCNDGVPLGSAWAQRTISVPASGYTKLRVWYRIFSQDKFVDENYDRFQIVVNGSVVKMDGNQTVVYGCTNPAQSQGWEYFDVNVAPYAGRNITLRLENWSAFDRWYNTWTYVDDIQFVP